MKKQRMDSMPGTVSIRRELTNSTSDAIYEKKGSGKGWWGSGNAKSNRGGSARTNHKSRKHAGGQRYARVVEGESVVIRSDIVESITSGRR
jgi:hypothetical protein